MIPRPLNEITWSDIEALRDSGREEDDMIEYKGSFSGGPDFLDFNDSQRNKSVDGIAKEAIAFLNGRGGDIVIGVKEAANDHPKIEEITPIANVDATADRLGQALAALIEPTQSVLGVRAVRRSEGDSDGVIVVRAPSSLRAPHRSTRSKECYVRRGRQSVAMPMDEVQDLTLNRSARRSERMTLLNEQIDLLKSGHLGLYQIPDDRIHLRCVYVPLQSYDNPVDQKLLSQFLGNDPVVYRRDQEFRNDIVFRSLSGHWKPIVRGKRVADMNQWTEGTYFCSKEIYQNGAMAADMASSIAHDLFGTKSNGIYYDWVISFFANILKSMESTLELKPQFTDGFLQFAAFSSIDQNLIISGNHRSSAYAFIPGLTRFPVFEISGTEGFDDIFQQMQIDICALAGIECGTPYSFSKPA